MIKRHHWWCHHCQGHHHHAPQKGYSCTSNSCKCSKWCFHLSLLKPLLKGFLLCWNWYFSTYYKKISRATTAIFLYARVTVLSGARQQNFAGAGLLCTGTTFDLKNAPAKFMMQSCKFFPPQRGRQWRRMRQWSLQGYPRDNDNDNDGRHQRRRQHPTAAIRGQNLFVDLSNKGEDSSNQGTHKSIKYLE